MKLNNQPTSAVQLPPLRHYGSVPDVGASRPSSSSSNTSPTRHNSLTSARGFYAQRQHVSGRHPFQGRHSYNGRLPNSGRLHNGGWESGGGRHSYSGRLPNGGWDSNGRQSMKNRIRNREKSNSASLAEARPQMFQNPLFDGLWSPNPNFIKRSSSEECLKCMLKMPHEKCQGHKYIRIGGGYRHSLLFVKAMIEELELRREQELLRIKRLEAIQEKGVKAIKTYIRTKSGNLRERVIFMSEEDYMAFIKAGGEGEEALELLRRYLNQDEAAGLESWDKEEQKAVVTYIRTKSGRRVAKTVYVNKSDYDAIRRGDVSANDVLQKYVRPEDGETLDGWGEAEMKAVKTWVRTGSGRLIEKTILMSKEDYLKLEELKREGKDPRELLEKYMSMDGGDVVESWGKAEGRAMKVIKTTVRTKSGRLVEKTIMMTEEEFKQFQESGGDVNFLRRFLSDVSKDDVIEDWDKASTVYSADSDDELVQQAAPGMMVVDQDGNVYEVMVDPITGKKYKKKVRGAADTTQKKPKGKNKLGVSEEDPAEKGMSREEVAAYRGGKRRDGSDSDYSYRSLVSAGGTRRVMRRKRRGDGTYSAEEEYNSDQDEEGKKRRQKRRQERKAEVIKERKKRFEQGRRNEGSDSDFSYRSIVSAGGTRHVKRRRKRADGTYSAEHSYHSSGDEEGRARRKQRRQRRREKVKAGGRQDDSDSDFSYRSVISAGGTRHVKRRRKKADGTYSAEESYHSSQDEAGRERRKKRRGERQKKIKEGGRRAESDSEFSYRSVISAGGTRHVKRRRKKADGTYSAEESYNSSQDEAGRARRRRRRRDRKHVGSANSYYSVVSEGGTRRVRRKRRRGDGTYSTSESYQSAESDARKPARVHGSGSEYSYYSEVSEGGTRKRKRKKRLRDEKGRVIGHGEVEDYSSPDESEADRYEWVDDGKGGKMKVKKTKSKRISENGKKKGGVSAGNMTDFSGSLLSTDSENEPDLSGMTPEERAAYLAAKASRKAAREQRRREAYGDKYDAMMDKHAKAKQAKKATKSMVTYDKGVGRNAKKAEVDNRDIGLSQDEWAKKGAVRTKSGRMRTKSGRHVITKSGRRIRAEDGNEADDESDDAMSLYEVGADGKKRKVKRKLKKDEEFVLELDEHGKLVKRVKKKGEKEDDEESLYDYVRDKEGNILFDEHGNPMKKKIGTIKKGLLKKGQRLIDPSDPNYEYKYDSRGNLVRVRKGEKMPDDDSEGDYFEVGPDGQLRMKQGRKKIDISKLGEEELRELGIDLKTMSKEEVARVLKERFGEEIQITKGGKKVGLKNIDEYSDANTDDLANDSDLDTSTLVGLKRVKVLMKRGGTQIIEHMKRMIEKSTLVDEQTQEERDASIDFMNHYKLVDTGRVDMYARAFVVNDEDLDFSVNAREARKALEGVPTIQSISSKQLQYVLKVLDIDRESDISFRMFAVLTAVAERVTHMDQYCKELLEVTDLIDIERKMELYKTMFYCNIPGDRDPNYITAESLKIELMAGGLSWDQQEYIMERMEPNEWREISFLDYLAYIPLFLSMHDKMITNPLDMSNTKYQPHRQPTAVYSRDLNPLGQPLSQRSYWMNKQRLRHGVFPPAGPGGSGFTQAGERGSSPGENYTKARGLLTGRDDDVRKEGIEVFNKYQKLPHIGSLSHPPTAKVKFSGV